MENELDLQSAPTRDSVNLSVGAQKLKLLLLCCDSVSGQANSLSRIAIVLPWPV